MGNVVHSARVDEMGDGWSGCRVRAITAAVVDVVVVVDGVECVLRHFNLFVKQILF